MGDVLKVAFSETEDKGFKLIFIERIYLLNREMASYVLNPIMNCVIMDVQFIAFQLFWFDRHHGLENLLEVYQNAGPWDCSQTSTE